MPIHVTGLPDFNPYKSENSDIKTLCFLGLKFIEANEIMPFRAVIRPFSVYLFESLIPMELAAKV